jgi:hypothetical protein
MEYYFFLAKNTETCFYGNLREIHRRNDLGAGY